MMYVHVKYTITVANILGLYINMQRMQHWTSAIIMFDANIAHGIDKYTIPININ